MKMKVLHVAGPNSGGIASHIRQLRQGLAVRGVESALAPPATVRPNSLVQVARELKRGRYDLVHCHGFQGGAVGRVAARMLGIPALVTIHNTLQAGGIAGRCAILTENMLRSCTAKWVAVSAFLRNYAWNVLKVPDERTEVIANGIDMPQELPPWSSGPVVGVVARLVPSKGVDVFLRAVQLLRPEIPELKAVIIGHGPAENELKYMAQSLGLKNTVKFLGHCQDVPSLLKGISVFVLPTRSEGLGISILEAMAMGVPVVATAVGGVPELVRHRQTGILVRVDEFGAIARAVKQILNNREETEAMRRAAFEHVRAKHSAAQMVERTLDVYRQVVHG
jgi:glycosyltransferase involved in cell wall biosynthesis